MKIAKLKTSRKTLYNVRYPDKDNRKNKSFKTVDEALNFACCVSEMIEHIDADILDHIFKTKHKIMKCHSLEFC
jgi:hypothetical protein